MATASFSILPTRAFPFYSPNYHNRQHSFPIISHQITNPHFNNFSHSSSSVCNQKTYPSVIFASSGGGGDGVIGGGGSSGSGGGDGGGSDPDDDARSRNRTEAFFALAEGGRTLGELSKDLAGAIEAGRVPASIVKRYLELEKSPVFRWLLNFGGFKERLLADDLFLAKVAMECGVGIFTKTAAELERRRENFTKELDFVCADVVMAIIADFMLVWLPAPTVALRPPPALSAGPVAKFLYSCPDNAFQVALTGTSYSLLQRICAIVRNGAKLFAVGTSASLIGVGITNALINARKAIDKSFAGEAEDVPLISTSVAYGVYMAVSSNLRYQVLAGVIEQRILEPLLHQHKLILGAVCFAFRTGNTFLGSLIIHIYEKVGRLCSMGWNPEDTGIEQRKRLGHAVSAG